ncbi:MAG: WGR domain-containing protein [Bacteroidota bacterium]
MKLIQQSKLYFQDEKSDKIYEVDLCQVGSNAYLVNFRYGRRGTVLRTGTKTDLPVGLAAAQALFDKLVSSKTKKGYKLAGTPLEALTEAPVTDAVDPDELDPSLALPLQIVCSPEHVHNMIKALEREMNGRSAPLSDPEPSNASPVEPPNSIWGVFKKMVGFENDADRPPTDPPPRKSSKEQVPRTRLSRLVWRCGELKMEAALPQLLSVVIGEDAMLDYSLAWALGRIKHADGLDRLDQLFILGQTQGDGALQVISEVSKLECLVDDDRQKFVSELVQGMPEDWQKSIVNQQPEQLEEAMHQILQKPEAAYFYLADLYLIGPTFPSARKALLAWVKEAPLKGKGYFKTIRQLLKAAELRDDAELLGLIAYKIQKGRPTFQNAKWGYQYLDGKYFRTAEEIVKSNSRVAFSIATKQYLIKRFVRNLRRKGKVADPDFVRMATGILVAYRDTDMGAASSKTFWKYVQGENNRWNSVSNTIHYPSFSLYPILAYLLFGNSERFEPDPSGKSWRWCSSADPTITEVTQREEAYPELWNRQVEGLLHLLVEGQCQVVHDFAVKAAKANQRKIQSLVNLEFTKILLGKKYKATTLFGLDLLKSMIGDQQIDPDLVLLLLRHQEVEVRTFGSELLRSHQANLVKQSNFVSELLFIAHEAVVQQVDDLLKAHAFTREQAIAVIGRAIAKMMALSEQANEDERQRTLVAGEHLSQHFQEELYRVHFQLIYDLLNHPLEELKVFAAKILRHYQIPVEDLPEDLLLGLINGESPELRKLGVDLLGRLPDSILQDKLELLCGLCASSHPEVRQTVRPVVQRLAQKEDSFGQGMVQLLAPILLRKEEEEGRDEDLIQLLTVDLQDQLKVLSLEQTLQLLYAPRKAAHRLGGHLLHHFINAEDLTIRQMVRLGSNELVKVRQWVWQAYEQNVMRIKYESREAVRLLDASWEDSRDWAFEFFSSKFTSADWSADVLVSICDSVFPMVQQFGRAMITQHFQAEDGEQYLLQLSEHPSPDLQHFATNYLQEYAADQPKKIEELEHYFITLLSQVNKAGVAKKRIFAFLKAEGIKSVSTATVVARVISRQSATMAIGDKSRCIQIMRDLSNHFPQLNLPLNQLEFETYPTYTKKENA